MSVIAVFLIKLAKHMALLACLAILGAVKDRLNVGQLVIFFIVLTAVVLYSVGRTLERRSPSPMHFFRDGR